MAVVEHGRIAMECLKFAVLCDDGRGPGGRSRLINAVVVQVAAVPDSEERGNEISDAVSRCLPT